MIGWISVQKFKNWWKKWGVLVISVAVGGWLRLKNLDTPADYVFDEVYHAPVVDMMARGDARAWEWWHTMDEVSAEYGAGTMIDWLHPPLAKLVQSIPVRIWGYHWWTIRLASALCGTATIVVMYWLAREAWPGRRGLAQAAAALLAIDGVHVAMSRLCMNDVRSPTILMPMRLRRPTLRVM